MSTQEDPLTALRLAAYSYKEKDLPGWNPTGLIRPVN